MNHTTPIGTRRRVIGIQPGLGPFTILVVDDRSENRMSLVRMLAVVGYDTRESPSGEQAIVEVVDTPPDAILTGLWLPDTSGLEAIRRLHQIETLNLTPIVAVSASALESDCQRALAAGADDCIAGPYRELDLLECLRSLMDIEYVYAPGLSAPGTRGGYGPRHIP